MGRIKDLLEKKATGTLTEDEAVELKELQADAKAMQEASQKQADSEDKEIDDLANKFAESVMSKVDSKLDKITKALEDRPVVTEVKAAPAFIVDKKYGQKTVEELADIKFTLTNRQGKEHTEISAKSIHFLNALATGDKQKLQLLTEGTAASGGYLVPDDFANMIIEDIRDNTVMRNIADVMSTSSDTFHLPNLASRPKASWRSEAAVKNTSTATFGENVFTPYSLAVIVGLSDELVADAALGVGNIVNYVSQLMAQSLGEEEDKAFFTGSGTGQPTGISTYSLGTVVAGGTDVSKSDAVISTFMRVPQGYRQRGVWVGNSATIENVQKLKDGQNNYLISRLADSPVLTLKGRPVYEQNDIAVGTLYYGDFSYYKIVDREGVRVRVSDEATVASQSAFERDLTFIRVEKRVDGELTLPQAIRKVTGI